MELHNLVNSDRKPPKKPRFYFGGNRYMKSDQTFIDRCINRLSVENQILASEQYENLYLRFFNKEEYAKARNEANRFLLDFANQYGISKEEYQKAKTENKKTADLMRKVEELKKMKKANKKTILGMVGK